MQDNNGSRGLIRFGTFQADLEAGELFKGVKGFTTAGSAISLFVNSSRIPGRSGHRVVGQFEGGRIARKVFEQSGRYA